MEIKNTPIFPIANPCDKLKTSPTTNATNLASVIIRIDVGSDKLLFTGDAGVKSFKAVIDYPTSITDMTFLKVPHHGNNNNINKELIDLINPKYAFNSGNLYETPEVMGCLKSKKGRIVKSTRETGSDLEFNC